MIVIPGQVVNGAIKISPPVINILIWYRDISAIILGDENNQSLNRSINILLI